MSESTQQTLVCDPESADACLFCPNQGDLTDEHVFPAALGGEDVVPGATCSDCNGGFSKDFEASFNNDLEHLRYLLRIGNREGEVPSIKATTTIDGVELTVFLRPDGTFELQ